MLEPILHARLQSECADLVGGQTGAFTNAFSNAFSQPVLGRIYPTKSPDNAPVPFLVYSVTSTRPNPLLTGNSSHTEYTATVETFGFEFSTVLELASRIRDGLHLWRSQEVMLSVLTDGASEYDELGYGYSQDFTIKVRE